MKRAKCLRGTFNILGNREVGISIGEGSEVDLDQVIGARDGTPETLGDALGPHVAESFQILDEPVRRRRGAAAETQSEE